MEEDLEAEINCNTLITDNGPDISTLSEDARPYVDALTTKIKKARRAISRAEGIRHAPHS
jgi:hypothetical protein